MTLRLVAWWLFGVGVGIAAYAYLVYPLVLRVLGLFLRRPLEPTEPAAWPLVTFMVPAYNEEDSIARVLDSILAADYPADKRQILVGSDASTDRTDEIVLGYADQGVELVRMPHRSGKTATENTLREHRSGDIVIHVDASVRIEPRGPKLLVAACCHPEVGVASSRNVSTASASEVADSGESSYVGYEMWVRRLETRVFGIVGASGAFFANRRGLYPPLLPVALSSDFAAALIARRRGLRAVSVDDAICYVPRSPSLRREYRRKVRTMTRGLETLWYHRDLLNPFRYGVFAWMLCSHKLVRWLSLPALVVAVVGWVLLDLQRRSPLAVGALAAVGCIALLGWNWPAGRRVPRLVTFTTYVVAGIIASFVAWYRALRGELDPVWEPTRRH